jgi:hypothetical protein
MSHRVLKYGWFGWNNMPAWIASRDGRPLRQCRITDLHGDRAKLEVDRAYEIPNEFLLQLTAFSRSAFECKVVARQGTLIEIQFSRSSLFDRAKPKEVKFETAPRGFETEMRGFDTATRGFDTATRGHSRQDLQMLRGLANQRRTHRGAMRSALVVTGVASILIALAVMLDWVKFQPAGYELAGSTSSFFKKASEFRNSTIGR